MVVLLVVVAVVAASTVLPAAAGAPTPPVVSADVTPVAPGEDSRTNGTVATVDDSQPDDLEVQSGALTTVGYAGPASATQGENVTFLASVENAGEHEASGEVAFRFDADADGVLDANETVESVALEYAGGENGTHAFGLSVPETLEPGDYRYGFVTENGTTNGTLTVERAPASFEVVSLRGSSSATRAQQLSIVTIVENAGDERRTGTFEVRVDQDGDGELSADEVVRTHELELGPGSSVQYSLSAPVPNLEPGEYTYGVFTAVDERTATYEIYRSSPDEPTDTTTRDDVAQALYGMDFDELDKGEAWQAEDVYDRLPLADGVSLEDVETLEQISQRKYEKPFTVDSPHKRDEGQYTLTKAEAIDVQDTYDAQFGPLPTDPEYTRNELAHGIFWTSFDSLGPDSAVQVQAVYNRQPLADGQDDESVDTRRRIARDLFDDGVYVFGWQSLGSETGLTVDDLLRIQQAYDEQFDD